MSGVSLVEHFYENSSRFTVFVKNSILNVRLGSKYASVACKEYRNKSFCAKSLKLYGLFLRMGFNYLKVTKPQRGDSVLFTNQSPGVPGTHSINTLTTMIIGKTYVKCKCPVFINIKQTLHYRIAIE